MSATSLLKRLFSVDEYYQMYEAGLVYLPMVSE